MRAGRGGGTRAGAQQPSFSLSSLVARSLSVCVRVLLLLPVGSSLLPRLPDSFLQRIPYPFSGNRRVKRTNKQFPYSLNLLFRRDFVLLHFFFAPPPTTPSPSILPQKLDAVNRASTVFFVVIFSIIGSAYSFYSLNFLFGSDFLLFLFVDSS